VWSGGWQFGDWLDPKAPPDDPAAARTDPDLLATAFFAHSARLLSAACAVIGRSDDAAKYTELSERVTQAFRAEFSTPRGRLITESQTAYAIALAFGLLEPSQVGGAVERLAAMLKRDGMTIGTGFLGTPWICPVLADHGRDDLAYRLLTQERCPSWLYPVTKGATTIWERWDAIRPDNTINPGEMLSFNHYAFGAIGAWLYHRVAGLQADPAHPGWRRFTVAPLPGGDLEYARARVDTPHGKAECGWAIHGSSFELRVRVPPNTRATVVLPTNGDTHEVGSGVHQWTVEIDRATLERWRPSLAPASPVTMAELAGEPSVMEVIASVGMKIMTIGSYDEIGACTLEECIQRAGLDEEEANRLRDAVAAV
jgi:alpha-L-rhamnosidase